MRHNTQKFLARVFVSLLVLTSVALQQGCGGGGGSSGSSTPKLGMSVHATKIFRFSWNDVSGETEYRLMENPDGKSGYTQVATIPANSSQYDLTVSLPKRVNARYMLQACNSDGCTNSNEVAVSGNLVEGIGLLGSPEPTDRGFGASVALSENGNVLAIGALEKVYVLSKRNGDWVQQQVLTASNGELRDAFGLSVALNADGTVLAVGASYEDGSPTNPIEGPDDNAVTNSGAVYLFTNSNGIWAEQAYLKAPNATVDAAFGSDVAISADGNTVAIGAEGRDDYAGAAYVFSKQDGDWVQQAFLVGDTEKAGHFGRSIVLSGDGSVLAVGASYEGAVYLFDSSSGWAGQDYLTLSDPSSGFGNSVSLSADGTVLAVGAHEYAYVFSKDVDGWAEQTHFTASNWEDNDDFGFSLALSPEGGFLAVSAGMDDSGAAGINGEDDNAIGDSGAVYLFSNDGGAWNEVAYIKASNPMSNAYFGFDVALSKGADTLAVGVPDINEDAGGVYLY
jgi:hypothetical protein